MFEYDLFNSKHLAIYISKPFFQVVVATSVLTCCSWSSSLQRADALSTGDALAPLAHVGAWCATGGPLGEGGGGDMLEFLVFLGFEW